MNKRRILALVTSAVMSVGAMGTAVYAANFADINNVPWDGAKTYINAVADAGLMVGDYNDAGQKVFRANDGVTYCETMQLAYALMKDYSGKAVDSSIVTKYTSVMNGYKIPTWAHQAVAYGLENKVVTISEIPGFVNSSGAAVNATRQDVAIIFGRALSQVESVNSNPTLKYNDASSITAVAKPYVDLLYRLGIMTGDDLNNFNPKKSINRAEMAVVVSKTNDYLDEEGTSQAGTLSGEITNLVNVGNNTTIVVTSGSSTMQFTGNSTTGVLDSNGLRLLISQLSVGDDVLVSYNGDDIVSVLVTKSAEDSSSNSEYDVEGTFVSLGSYTIKLEVDGKEKTYELYDKDETYFRYDGSVKDYDKFKDLVSEGDKIGLEFDRNNYVTYVYATPGESDYDKEGYFDDISSSSIKIKSSKSGSAKTYDFEDEDSDNVKFYKSKSGSSIDYDDFKDYVEEDDKLGLILNSDDEVTKVYIIERADDEDYDEEGYFYSITSEKIRIKSSKSGDYDTYYFEDDDSDNVDFYKSKSGSSVSYSSFKDYVEEDDKIGLVYNSDDEVVKVYIIERAEDSDYDEEGYFYSMSSDKIRIKPTKSGDYETFYFEDDDSDNVDFYKSESGSSIDYDDFKDYVEEDDKIGLVTNSDDEVTKVYIISSSSSSDSSKGELYSLSSSRLRLKGDDESYVIDDADDIDVDVDDGDETIKDFDDLLDAYDDDNKGFYITIEYDDDYYVTDITGYIISIKDAEVTGVDRDDETITIRTEGGTKQT